MKVVLANKNDLEKINIIITKVIENMNKQGIKIWNEYYPSECFLGDIEKENLYLLKNNDEIVGMGVLCGFDESGDVFKFSGTKNNLFLTRFAINVDYLNMGYGKKLLEEMIHIAKNKDMDSIKLAVAKVNIPAIRLYEKYGFKKVDGVFYNKFITKCNNEEYGYELILKKDTV